MSDSECESFVVAQDVAAAAAKKKPAAAKRKSSSKAESTSSSSVKSQKKNKTVDVFGLCNENEYNDRVLQSKTLPSFVVNRVANGNQRRRVVSTSGEFYVELKVYERHDAEDAPKDTRWTKALLRLNCYLEEGSPQWKLLHRFVKETGTLFEDCVPSFYNPDLIKIKQAD